jgi:DNA-binding transcriptional ArsR family regulator
MPRALERLADTPTDTVRDQVDHHHARTGCHDSFAGWVAQPRKELTAFVSALAAFEHQVFRPLVPDLDGRLRVQAEHLAVAVSTDRDMRALSSIHPFITRRNDELQWPTMRRVNNSGIRSMVLFPMVASSRAILTSDHSEDNDRPNGQDVELAFAVPALALRDVPRGAPLDHDAPLKALLGPVRSAVLSAIATSAGHTTTTLSGQLQLSPSNVSYHLTALRKADLVDTERTGPNVVYRATAAGHRILTAWD